MRILLFHGVVPDHYDNLPPKIITESRFREVLDTLDNVFACTDIDINNLPTGQAITFDDGYWNNYEIAWPILKEYGFPWTIFLTTGFIGTDRVMWTDALDGLDGAAQYFQDERIFDIIKQWHKGYRELPRTNRIDPMLSKFMTWEQVNEMNEDPMVEFGAHTVNHVSLGNIAYSNLCEEISGSLNAVAEHCPPRLFAYPEGQTSDISEFAVEYLEDIGVEFAFTAMKDWVKPSPYWLPREMIC